MLKPLGDKIIIEVVEIDNKTRGGIILSSANQEKSNQGVVVAIGKEGDIAVGDKIIFMKYAGTETKYEGNDYLILRQEDVLAIIE